MIGFSQLPNVAITLRRDEPSRENTERQLTTDHTDSTDESQCLYPCHPRDPWSNFFWLVTAERDGYFVEDEL